MFSNRLLKSTLAILIVLVMTLGLVGCGSVEPSEDVFKDAYLRLVADSVEQLTIYTDKATNRNVNDISFDSTLSLDLSEDLISMLRSMTGESFEFVNDVTVNLNGTSKDKQMSVEAKVDYNKKDLISLTSIVDMAGGDVYVSIPLLAETCLKTSLYGLGVDVDAMLAPSQLDIVSLLPDMDAVASILNRYAGIALDNIPTPTFEKGELTVDDVTESCVIYTVKLGIKEAANMLLPILKEAKADKELKALILDFAEDMILQMGPEAEGMKPIDAWDEMVLGIDFMIGEITQSLEDEEFLAEDKTDIVWTSYITDKAELIGVKLDVSYETIQYDFDYNTYEYVEIPSIEKTVLFFGRAKDGKDVNVSCYVFYEEYAEASDNHNPASSGLPGGVSYPVEPMEATNLFEIKGDLTEDGNKLSGTYELLVAGESMCFLDLASVDTKLLEKGYLNGTVTLSPSRGLLELLDLDADEMGVLFSSLSLRVASEQDSDDESKLTVTLMNGSTPYVSVTLHTTTGKGTAVKLPDADDVTYNPEIWIENLNLSALADRAEECGLPAFIVELLETLVSPMDY